MSLKHLESGSDLPKQEKGIIRLYSMKYCKIEKFKKISTKSFLKIKLI